MSRIDKLTRDVARMCEAHLPDNTRRRVADTLRRIRLEAKRIERKTDEKTSAARDRICDSVLPARIHSVA